MAVDATVPLLSEQTERDAIRLFTHFGQLRAHASLHKEVLQDTAKEVACRWALLAEMVGIDSKVDITTDRQ